MIFGALGGDEQLALQVVVDGMGIFINNMNRIDSRIERSTHKWGGLSTFISRSLSYAFGHILVNAINSAFRAMQRLVGLGIDFAKDAIRSAIGFEEQMVKVQIAARDSGLSFDELSDAALALGEDVTIIGVDAGEAAVGLETFYLAGLDTATLFGGAGGLTQLLEGGQSALGAFKLAADLAAVSQFELNDAAEFSVQVLATFGQGVEEGTAQAEFLAESFDTIIAVADTTTAEIHDFEGALKNVGPTASGLGYTFEETAQAIGILSDRGIRANEAGTTLRRMLANLNRDTAKVREANAALGVSLFDNEGNLRSLTDVFQDYAAVLNTDPDSAVKSTIYVKDATEEQRRQYALAVDQLEKMNEKIADHNSGLKEVSDKTLEKYYRQQAAANQVIAEYGELGVVAREVTSQLTEEERARYVQTLAGVYGQNAFNALISESGLQFESLGEEMQTAFTLQERMAELQDTTAFEMEKLEGVIGTLKIQLGSAFLPVINRALVLFREWLDENRDLIEEGLERLSAWMEGPGQQMIGRFFQFLTELPGHISRVIQWWKNFRANLQQGGNWIQENLMPIFNQISDWFLLASPIIQDYVQTYWYGYLIPAFEELWNQIQTQVIPPLQELWAWFQEYVPQAIVYLAQVYDTILKPAMELFAQFMLEFVIPALGTLAGFILDVVVSALQFLAEMFFEHVGPALLQFYAWIAENVLPVLQQLVDWLIAEVLPALRDLANWITTTVIPAIQDMWRWIAEHIIPVLTDVAVFTYEFVTALLHLAEAVIRDIVMPILGEIWDRLQDLEDAFLAMVDALVDKLSPAFDTVYGWVKDNIIPILEDLWEWVKDKVGPIFEWFTTEVLDPTTSALDRLEDALQRIRDALQSAIDKLRSFKSEFAGFSVPDFVRGSSPPPLANWINDIGDAMDRVSGQSAPGMAAAFMSIPAPGFLAGTNITNNNLQDNRQYNLETNTLLGPGELSLEFREMELALR